MREGTPLNRTVRTEELFEVSTEYIKGMFDDATYPWEILPKISGHIKNLIENVPQEFEVLTDGVIVGKNVKISDSAVIIPPAVIGEGTEIRPGAYLRGNVICGKDCVIGNSSELKNCVLLDGVQVPHYNYVGDSILGNRAHMGAGAICSNLRTDKKEITVHADEEYRTGLRKLGGILADGADIGCGCVINPGAVIGKGTRVYPLTSVRGVIPERSIVKTMSEIVPIR